MIKTIRGESVPAIGLGTWELRGAECREAVSHALEIGYRHLDTAAAYDNEEDVGRALRTSGLAREEIFLTTKIPPEHLAPPAARRSAENSLRRLGTEYVDLLLIHWPNEEVPLEKTLDLMMELREEEKTRLIGVSNFPPSLLRRALRHSEIFCNQVEYHPFLRQDAVLEIAREHDLLLTAYSPVARGEVLSDGTIMEIAAAHGKSPVQIGLRWLVQQRQVAAIPKSGTPEHQAANLEIFDFELSEEEMERICGLVDEGLRLVDPAWGPDWEQ